MSIPLLEVVDFVTAREINIFKCGRIEWKQFTIRIIKISKRRTTVRETEHIANLIDFTRRYSHWYISKISPKQARIRLEVDGHRLHSPFWIVAHLSWTQQAIVRLAGGPEVQPVWLNYFRIHSSFEEKMHAEIDYETIIDLFNKTHQSTLEFVRNLDDAILDEVVDDASWQDFFKNKRIALQHLIRHEAYHTGQLGWFCKIMDIETI